MADRPNFLYLHCHDAGRYVQPYFPGIATPHLQRLAGEGTLFRQAFTVNPTCSPSRAALLTGQYAHCTGMLGLAHRGFRLSQPRRLLPWTLREAGYRTELCGVQHVISEPYSRPDDLGYDHIRNRAGDLDSVTAAATEFLRQPPAQPWFLDVGYFPPHRSGEGFPTRGDRVDARHVRPPAPLPDTPEIRADMAHYQTSVRGTDEAMGAVLAALAASGQADRTLVICTTDHGIAFPHMKCNLTDHGLGVLLILRGPGGFTGGRSLDAMVSHLDLFPTICNVAGIPAPDWLHGQSLLPLLNGRAELHDALFAEVNYHAAYEPKRAVRTRRWKYLRYFDGRDRVVLPNCDDSPSKTYLHQHGWAQRPRPEELLHDLVFDPHETQNLVADESCAEILADMRNRLARWMRETDDPLHRKALVPAPADARVNHPDGYSPQEPPELVKPAAKRSKRRRTSGTAGSDSAS
jgi:arylsulfatase A-like enzyme